jgi:hypothetical protein
VYAAEAALQAIRWLLTVRLTAGGRLKNYALSKVIRK